MRRLMALGLVDRFEDLVTPSRPAVAINALVKPKLDISWRPSVRSIRGVSSIRC